MPSARRVKTFGLLVFILVLITLYLTASARQTRSSQFYIKTQEALEQARAQKEKALVHDSEPGGDVEVGKRLKAAEEAAKAAADRKGDAFHGEEGKRKAEKVMAQKEKDTVISKTDEKGAERSVAGRKKLGNVVKTGAGKEAILKHKSELVEEAEQIVETEEDHKVKDELNDILKRSPVIIFSKSYCPHSARAKHILLETYKITPAPFVVELDQHDLGPQLQAKLAEMTGRRTVPNVLINGRSIGGGDDVAALDESDTLIEKVKSMGGKRMNVIKNEVRTEEGEKRRRRKRA